MQPATRAEATNYLETSRHADVMTFLAALATWGDARLVQSSFGTSPEGRDLPLLVLSAEGIRTPAEARALGRPIVLLQCGIHAGEVEGKEAVLMLVRDLLGGVHADAPALLSKVTVVVVPLFNPDGNDAIDAGNRALHLPRLSGQLGPASGVGTRVNAAKINLNRDYLRRDAVEMRLWLERVWQAWEPDLTLDNHATNGSVHRFAMTYDIPHTIASGRAEPILYMRDHLTPAVRDAVKSRHGFDSGWYGNFAEDERALDAGVDAAPAAPVREGWMTYPHHPRFGSNYRGLCGRMDLLLEAYAYIPFAERVGVAYAWMLETLRYVAAHGDAICAIVAESRTPPAEIAIRYRLEVAPEPVTILTRTPRTLEGAPTEVALPHVSRFVGTTVVTRPRAYLVPPAIAEALRGHGLQVDAPTGEYAIQVPIVEALAQTEGRAILEASATGDVRVRWQATRRMAPAGWGIVATDQRYGAIAVYLCEPESDDGALENGLIGLGRAWRAGDELPLWRVD